MTLPPPKYFKRSIFAHSDGSKKEYDFKIQKAGTRSKCMNEIERPNNEHRRTRELVIEAVPFVRKTKKVKNNV